MIATVPQLIGEDFPAHPQSAALFSIRIEFGPAFAAKTSMNRATLIKTLRGHAETLGDTLPAHIMAHIANYMQAYVDQLPKEPREKYLNGTVGRVVENSFYREGSDRPVFDTATGCCFVI